jgi:hypothetical protein
MTFVAFAIAGAAEIYAVYRLRPWMHELDSLVVCLAGVQAVYMTTFGHLYSAVWWAFVARAWHWWTTERFVKQQRRAWRALEQL